MVIIKLGDMVYTGEEGSGGYELLRFLNAIMYPHQKDFMEVASEYIDFSECGCLVEGRCRRSRCLERQPAVITSRNKPDNN